MTLTLTLALTLTLSQAAIKEGDARVLREHDAGQKRLAESIAEGGEFAAKAAAQAERRLMVAVEEAEKRGRNSIMGGNPNPNPLPNPKNGRKPLPDWRRDRERP